MQLLASAKRLGLSLDELAAIDVQTLVDMGAEWEGAYRADVRPATQADIDALWK